MTRHPRTHVRRALTVLRVDLATALERWRVNNTIRIPVHLRPQHGGKTQRARLPWECPENNVADWRVLARELDHMTQAIADLRAFVDEQLDRFTCDQCQRDIPGDEVRAGFVRCEHCDRERNHVAAR